MKKVLLILCLLAFTGTAYAAADYTRDTSPLSVGKTDKYFRDLNSWDSSNLYVPGQPYNYDPQVFGTSGPYKNTQPQGHYVYTETGTTQDGTAAADPTRYYNQGININSPEYKEAKARGEKVAPTTNSAAIQEQAPKRRWNKNASENHYNFGGTGFKSKGFSQGY